MISSLRPDHGHAEAVPDVCRTRRSAPVCSWERQGRFSASTFYQLTLVLKTSRRRLLSESLFHFCAFNTFALHSLRLTIDRIADPEAPVPLVPPGVPRRLHGHLRIQAVVRQEVAEHAAPHHRARPLLQRAQRRRRRHGRHPDAATAAQSRSDCLQVLEKFRSSSFVKEEEEGQTRVPEPFLVLFSPPSPHPFFSPSARHFHEGMF